MPSIVCGCQRDRYLIYSALPTKDRYKMWEREVMHHSVVHSDTKDFFRSFRYDTHPMAIFTSSFAYLGSYYADANPSLRGLMDQQIFRLIGKRHDFVIPPTGLSYTGAFLYMMDRQGQEDFKPHPVLGRALDTLFLLHADHELNASATMVLQTVDNILRPIASREIDMYV
ncbi:citrate synthase [Athelia psychrophila]|uniref:Citrate synthase n=1 Tax=Athelia psychrophila TaxID=1759441 RepID=A0A165YKS0_9AGAM|nr:citrate synthase [Fibularhizoctonia sp. CBS 109695]